MLIALLPVQVAVQPAWSILYNTALLPEALHIAGRAAAILFILTALIGTVEPAALGHALAHLRVPARLVQLYLFTIRYLDVLRREAQTLHTAMRARGYAPGFNRPALRATGQMVGMLLVRSLDRSEAIVRAMACRGEHGAFHLFRHFHYHRRDAVFALLAAATGLLLITGWPAP
jgi:cobalt/nickel transport system permease protein